MELVWHEHYKTFIPVFDLATLEGIRECVAYEGPWYGDEAWGSLGHDVAKTLLKLIDEKEEVSA